MYSYNSEQYRWYRSTSPTAVFTNKSRSDKYYSILYKIYKTMRHVIRGKIFVFTLMYYFLNKINYAFYFSLGYTFTVYWSVQWNVSHGIPRSDCNHSSKRLCRNQKHVSCFITLLCRFNCLPWINNKFKTYTLIR